MAEPVESLESKSLLVRTGTQHRKSWSLQIVRPAGVNGHCAPFWDNGEQNGLSFCKYSRCQNFFL